MVWLEQVGRSDHERRGHDALHVRRGECAWSCGCRVYSGCGSGCRPCEPVAGTGKQKIGDRLAAGKAELAGARIVHAGGVVPCTCFRLTGRLLPPGPPWASLPSAPAHSR